eukprot:scaffold129614_cov50-Cyclotella_meneghiniana.AAC.1
MVDLRMRIAIAIADLSCGLVDLWIFSFHVAGVRREESPVSSLPLPTLTKWHDPSQPHDRVVNVNRVLGVVLAGPKPPHYGRANPPT